MQCIEAWSGLLVEGALLPGVSWGRKIMGKNLFDLRFGLKREDGYISNVWRLWVTHPGDVYLATKGMGGVEKYSFHKSGICRSAFTKEHGAPSSMSERALFKWRRARTPFGGSGHASRVAWISFPTDFLSRYEGKNTKKINWIPAAPNGAATFLELAYTKELKSTVISKFEETGRDLVSYIALPGGEAFFLSYYYADWENRELRSPARKGSVFSDLIFSPEDPTDTGRPIRIRLGPAPKDGDALLLKELGGYEVKSL